MAAVTLRLAWQNRVDSATLSASSTSGSLTVGRLARDDIQDLWRASSTTAWLLADLVTARTIGVVALINSNAGLTDAFRVRVSSSDATGVAGDVYDSALILAGVDTTDRKFVHFIEPAVSGRYVRIDMAQSTAPEAGRLLIAPTWTPTRHFSFGWETVWRDWSERTVSRGLNLIRDRRARQYGYAFVLNGLTSDEVNDEIESLNRLKGMSADILVCRDTGASPLGKATVWGPMGSMIRVAQRIPDFFVSEFTVWNRL